MRVLEFAYTPDPDDAFHHYGLEHGRIESAVIRPRFHRDHVHHLNQRAERGEAEITAISSASYPALASRYAILASGASVGRGYGPVLAARPGFRESLKGRRVAVPGRTTTGARLLSTFHPDCITVPLPFDAIAPAIAAGEVEAGVLIHEELLHWQVSGVEKVECLGERWTRSTGLPLPVGLIVGRRDLGQEILEETQLLLRRSMEYALQGPGHRAEALAFARQFGRGAASRHREEFIDKFANTDTVRMPEDVRRGLAAFYGPIAVPLDIVEHPRSLEVSVVELAS